jgi:hypothetical protein
MWWCNYGGLYGAAHCAQYSIYSCLVINLPSATTSRSQLGIRSTAIADWCSHIGPVHLERRRSYRRERERERELHEAHHPAHIGDEAMRIHRREWGADGTGGSWELTLWQIHTKGIYLCTSSSTVSLSYDENVVEIGWAAQSVLPFGKERARLLLHTKWQIEMNKSFGTSRVWGDRERESRKGTGNFDKDDRRER